jgi:imidazolonepropionase-like amidohydrolase
MVKCKADSLEHGAVGIKGPNDEIIELMKKNGTHYVPTLVVHENLSMDHEGMEAFLNDNQLRRSVSPVTIQNFIKTIKGRKKGSHAIPSKRNLERMRRNMRILHQDIMKSLKWVRNAGIPVVAGSDTGNFLTFPGVSLHREIELLVDSGLSPMEAISAATANAARLLGTEDKIGTVEKGKLADIIIVDGNPTSNISDIRKVETVIKNGQIVDSRKLADKISAVH